ncbi:MAG: tetratricopeptide repeat protein [Planctomycetota bacterium]|jgi:tetratricopeptide (TPR) repeat protein
MRCAIVVWVLAGFAAAADSRTAEEWRKLARGQIEQEQYEDAWETLESAIEAHPGDARLRLALGDVFFRLGEREQRAGGSATSITNFYLDAERMYDEALGLDAQSFDAVYGKARANYNLSGTVAGTKEKAAALVARCLALDPEHGGALALEGHLFYGDRKYAHAACSFGLALSRGVADLTAYVRRGHCAYTQGRTDEAKEAYLDALRRHPTSDVPIRSGLYYLAGKDWQNAVPLLREATEAAPRSAPAWFYLGFGRYAGESWGPAAVAFGRAVELAPQDANAHYYLGAATQKRGDGDAALEHFRRALKADPAHAEAADAFGRRIRAKARHHGEFMRLYEELLVLAPANPWVRNNYAYSLRNAAEMTGAANTAAVPEEVILLLRRSGEVYEDVARMRPDDPQIQSDTGLVYEFYPAVRDDTKATTYFTRALDLTGSRYRDAMNGLIRLCERNHDWKTLHEHTSVAAAALAEGEPGLYPTEAGEILPTGDEGTRQLRAEVDRALALAQHHLDHPGAGRPVVIPVVLHRGGGDGWTVPQGWGIEKPASDPQGEPVKLALDLAAGAVHAFETKVVTNEQMAGVPSGAQTHNVRAQLTVDRVEAAEATASWTSNGDEAVGDGRLVARLDAAGRIREGSVEAIDVSDARLEPKVARALHMGVVPLPDRPVRVGETWAVPLGPALVCDTVLPLADAEVRVEAYQTLVGFETVDGANCALIEMVFAATIRSTTLKLARHMRAVPGTIRVQGSCVVLHGLDGHTRRITWKKRQWCKLAGAKAGAKTPALPAGLPGGARAVRSSGLEIRRESTWETIGGA